MHSDEQEIRQLVSTWMSATRSGDVETILPLMTDDVVFLVTGGHIMRKAGFAAAARAQADPASPQFEGASEIQEIKVLGDWAFMWTRLTVTTKPTGAAPASTRSGHTLSILQKRNGKWLLARDANMLGPASSA